MQLSSGTFSLCRIFIKILKPSAQRQVVGTLNTKLAGQSNVDTTRDLKLPRSTHYCDSVDCLITPRIFRTVYQQGSSHLMCLMFARLDQTLFSPFIRSDQHRACAHKGHSLSGWSYEEKKKKRKVKETTILKILG